MIYINGLRRYLSKTESNWIDPNVDGVFRTALFWYSVII